MRRLIAIAGLAGLAGASGAAQGQIVKLPSQQAVDRCIAEEKQRDALALRRFGQRTRPDSEIRQFCETDEARRYTDRMLGRAPQPGPPPIPFPARPGRSRTWGGKAAGGVGAVGSELSIGGAWRSVGTETTTDNRNMYFIDTALVRREGMIASGWLTAFYERAYPDGAASTAYWAHVDCSTGRWAYQLVAIRNEARRVLRQEQPSRGWQPATTNPMAPLTHLRRSLCAGETPGWEVPRDRAPGDVAREWFAHNPR